MDARLTVTPELQHVEDTVLVLLDLGGQRLGERSGPSLPSAGQRGP